MAETPAIHDLRLMTSLEVKAALPTIGCLLVPVGSCEQHGPNLALAADAALMPGDLVESRVRHTRSLGSLIHRAYHWEERTRNGVLGDAAAAASAAHGREMIERGLDILCEFLEDFMALPAPVSAEVACP